MKPRRRADSTSQSCSCTSYLYTSESDNIPIRRYFAHDSRASQFYFEKFIPLHEKNLLNRFTKTGAVFDDLKSHLNCDGTLYSEKNTYSKPGKPVTNCLESNQLGASQLVDIYNKGFQLNANLSKCYSCLSNVKILGVKNELNRNSARVYEEVSGQTRKISKRENIHVTTCEKKIVKTERGRTRERHYKRDIGFKAKYIRSDPCTCTLKYSRLMKKQSKAVIRQIRNVRYVLHEPINLKKQHFMRKSYQIYKKRQEKLEDNMKVINENKKNVTRKIQLHAKKSLEEVKPVKTKLISTEIESSVKKSFQYLEDCKMKNHAIVKLNDNLERKDMMKFWERNIECEPETDVSDKKNKRYCHNYTAEHKMFSQETKLDGNTLSKFNTVFQAKKFAKAKRAPRSQLTDERLEFQCEEVNKISMKHHGKPPIDEKSVDFELSATNEEYDSSNSKVKHNIKSINKVLRNKEPKAVRKTDQVYLYKQALHIKSQFNFDVEFYNKVPESKTSQTCQSSEIYKNIRDRQKERYQQKRTKIVVKPPAEASISITQTLNARLIHKDESGDSDILLKPNNLVFERIQSERSFMNFKSNTVCGNKTVNISKHNLMTVKNNLSTFSPGDALKRGTRDIFLSQKPALCIESKFPFNGELYTKTKENDLRVALTDRKIKKILSSLTIKKVHDSCEMIKVNRVCIKSYRNAKNIILNKCFRILKWHGKVKTQNKNKKSAAIITPSPFRMTKNVLKMNNYSLNIAKVSFQSCKCASDIGIRREYDPIFGQNIVNSNAVGSYVNCRKTKSSSSIAPSHFHSAITVLRMGKKSSPLRYNERLNFGQNKIQKTHISSLGRLAVHTRSSLNLNIEFYKNRLALSASNKASLSNTAREMQYNHTIFKNYDNQGSSFKRRLFALKLYKNKLNKKFMLQNTKKITINTKTVAEVAMDNANNKRIKTKKQSCFFKLLPFKRTLYNNLPSFHFNTLDYGTVNPEMTPVPKLTCNYLPKNEETPEPSGSIPTKTNVVSMYTHPKSPYFTFTRGSGEIINATKAKQAVKIRSCLNSSIELSKIIPDVVDFATYSKDVEIKKKMDKDKVKSANKVHANNFVTKVSGLRKRAALVRSMFKRCFCTINLQKKNKNQHYKSNLNLDSVVKSFNSNAIGRAKTAKTQFISHTFGLEGERKCQLFENRNKLMSISASSFLLNKYINSLESEYSNLKIYSIFNIPKQFYQPLTIKSNLSMTVKIMRQLQFCSVPIFWKNSTETFSHIYKNEKVYDCLRIIGQESNQSQTKIDTGQGTETGIERYLERNFCTMNVKISNAGVPPSVNDASNKIKPFEYECQCDSYERKKHVKRQNVKNAHKCSGANKVISKTSVGSYPQQRRESLQVGSSFSFNLEFFKSQTEPSENNMRQHETRSGHKIPLDQNKYKSVSKGCQTKKIQINDSENKGSQEKRIQRLHNKKVQKTTATVDKASGALKERAICTFKLQKLGKIYKENANIKKNYAVKAQKTKPKFAKIGTDTKYQKKIIVSKNPKCCEYEQGDHVVEDGVPQKCQGVMKNHGNKCINTKPEKESVSSTTSQEQLKSRNKTCSVDITRNTKHKSINSIKCTTHSDNTNIHISGDDVPHKYVGPMQDHKDFCINTKSEKDSISDISQEHSKAKKKSRSVDTTQNTNHKRTSTCKCSKYNDNTNAHVPIDGDPHKHPETMKNHKDFCINTKSVKKSNSSTSQGNFKAKNKTRSVETTRNTNHKGTNAVKCTKCIDNTNAHVPGDVVYHKHPEPMKNHKYFDINTKSVKKSNSSTSNGHLQAKHKTCSVDTKRNTNHKSMNAVKYTKHNDNTQPAISERNCRPVVRIDSNFSFNIEIVKDTPQFQSNPQKIITKDIKIGKGQINLKKKAISCDCQTAKDHFDKNNKVKCPCDKFHTATEPKLHSIEIRKKRNSTSFKEKFFYWLGLRRKGKKSSQPTELVEYRSNRNNNELYTNKAVQTTERTFNKKQRQKEPVSSQFTRRLCPLDHCDSYLCNEIIQDSHIKQDLKRSGDESVQTQSRSLEQRKGIKNERIQVQNPTNNFKQKQHIFNMMPTDKMINNDVSDKRLVRIGSNFSFNIEFYKENLNGHNINDTAERVNTLSLKKCQHETRKKRLILKNTTNKTPKCPTVRSNVSQVSKELKTSGFKSSLVPCFCNLDLKNTQIGKLNRMKIKSHKDIKPAIITKSIETQPNSEKFKNRIQDIPQNLSLYEYKSCVHDTDKRVPVQCMNQIKKKQEQTKDYGVATDYPKNKSIGSVATRMKNENLQTYIPSGDTNVVPKTNYIGESYKRLKSSRSPSRPAVRIGSNFSFKIEFFKDYGIGKPQIEVIQQQLPSTHNYSKKDLQRQAKYELPHLRDNVNSQAMLTKTNSAENVIPNMKQCLYTLQSKNDKLNNDKNISIKSQSDQPKSNRSSVRKFLRKWICTLRLYKTGKLQNCLPTPVVQYKVKSTCTDSQQIPKDRIEKFTKLLEGYENEPYFCVPRCTCDYLEPSQRRQFRDFGTNNKRNLKDSATYSVRESMTKSEKIQCHKCRKLNSRGTYISKSHSIGKEIAQYYPQFSPNVDNQVQKHNLKRKQPKSKIKPCGKVIVNNNKPDKRLARIGSNFSFSMEFFKANQKTNTVISRKKNQRTKKEPKFRSKSKKIREEPRGCITRLCPSYKSAQSQSSKKRRKKIESNTVSNISLSKRKLLKKTKPSKLKLQHQPNSIKTKDKLIATKVKCGCPRASGTPNLRYFHGGYDQNDSLDKINISEIFHKYCVERTRPERKSTASVGLCRCKPKAQKNQSQTAKQRNASKHKNVAAKTGTFRHKNVQMDSSKLKDQSSGTGNLFDKGCTLKLKKPARQKNFFKSFKRKADAVYPQKFTVRTAIIRPLHKDLKTCPFKETASIRSVYNKIYLRNAKSNTQIILPYASSKVNRKSSKNLHENNATIGFSSQDKRTLTAKKTKKSFGNTTGIKSKENTFLFYRWVRFFTRTAEARPKDSGLQKNINMYDKYAKPSRLKSYLVPNMDNQKTSTAIFGENCFYVCANKMKEPKHLIIQNGDLDYNLNEIDNHHLKKHEVAPKLNSMRPKMHVTFADIKNSRSNILNEKRKKIRIYKSKSQLSYSCSVNNCLSSSYNINGDHNVLESFDVFRKNKIKSNKNVFSYSESVNECPFSMCSKRKFEMIEMECKGGNAERSIKSLLCKRDSAMGPHAIDTVNGKMCKRYNRPCIVKSKKCALKLKRKKNKRSLVKQGLRSKKIKKNSKAGDILVGNLGITVRGAINNTAKSVSVLKVCCEKCKLSKKRNSDSVNKTIQKIQEQ